jgi:hypothetical protein
VISPRPDNVTALCGHEQNLPSTAISSAAARSSASAATALHTPTSAHGRFTAGNRASYLPVATWSVPVIASTSPTAIRVRGAAEPMSAFCRWLRRPQGRNGIVIGAVHRCAGNPRGSISAMRRSLALGLRVASVPVGVGVGLWTAQLTPNEYSCPPNGLCLLFNLYLRPTLAIWQSMLFGAGAGAVLLLLSLAVARLPSPTAFKFSGLAAVIAGLGVGLWMAQPQSLEQCSSYAACPAQRGLLLVPTFATWQCVLFGAGAVAVVLLVTVAVARLPSSRSLRTA